MYSKNTKSTALKTERPAQLQSRREVTTERGLLASRGSSIDARASLRAATRPASVDRLGTTFTFLLSLALLAGGSVLIAQIWTNLAMVR
jgi:hypothetical protein